MLAFEHIASLLLTFLAAHTFAFAPIVLQQGLVSNGLHSRQFRPFHVKEVKANTYGFFTHLLGKKFLLYCDSRPVFSLVHILIYETTALSADESKEESRTEVVGRVQRVPSDLYDEETRSPDGSISRGSTPNGTTESA